jgi:hypothetical protein
MTLTIISFSIFILYLVASLFIFGDIPASLSDTYYMLKSKREWMKWLFPLMIYSISGLLMPAWLDATEGGNLQFLSFLTCASLLLVGSAPNFKRVGAENKIHYISAIVSAVCAMLWCLLVTHTWYVIVSCVVLMLLFAISTSTLRKSYIFWLEMIAFASLYMSLLSY